VVEALATAGSGTASAAAIAVRLPTALATTASFVLIVVGSRR
jgi:hypothetical protein